jgi:hypothetical protein
MSGVVGRVNVNLPLKRKKERLKDNLKEPQRRTEQGDRERRERSGSVVSSQCGADSQTQAATRILNQLRI